MKKYLLFVLLTLAQAACMSPVHAGGFGGAVTTASQLQGIVQLNQGGTGLSVISSANDGKFLRLQGGGTSAVWDGVNTYLTVSMISNAGAFSVDDSGQYIVSITGALTANGALSATFTVPYDPTTVIFNNATTGAFSLVLNGTYTIPSGVSIWYWDGTALNNVTNAYNSAGVAITAGAINGTTIGATTPVVGNFSAVSGGVSSGANGFTLTNTFGDPTFAAMYLSSITPSASNWVLRSGAGNNLNLNAASVITMFIGGANTGVNVNSGGLNATAIGATTPGTVAATTFTGGGTGLTGTAASLSIGGNAATATAATTATNQSGGTVSATTNNASTSYSLDGKLLASATVPTIASGFGTSPSILHNNGSAIIDFTVGSGGTASTGIINMGSSAPNFWGCAANYIGLPQPNTVTVATQTSATTITVTNILVSTAATSPWPNGQQIQLICFPY